MNKKLPKELMDILCCPADHGRLKPVKDSLICSICSRMYPVNDGIPIMSPPLELR